MPRIIDPTYRDPVDLIWLATASRLGMKVERSTEVYAAWDGATITLADAESFDPDDSLAQLIFHEICHALTEGDEAFSKPDWGLDNLTDEDLWREHACLRLQAALAAEHGLRGVLAPTTEHRVYYDDLPADALSGDEPAAAAARDAFARAADGPWREPLQAALGATAAIAAAAAPFVDEASLWARYAR